MRIVSVILLHLILAANVFARTDGKIRVIVGVRLTEDEQKPEKKRAASKAAKEKFFAKHPDVKPAKGHDYDAIPFFTTEIDARKLDELAADAEVASIEEDFVMRAGLAQSAPLVSANIAWSQGRDGTGQAVAILDTGVDAAHPFFGGRVVHQACFSTAIGTDYSSTCPNGGPTQTGTGTGVPCNFAGCDHGTHVAGIAAGRDPGGVGFSGIARNASILALQTFVRGNNVPACGGDPAPCARVIYSDVIAALNYVDGLRNTYSIASTNMSIYTFNSPRTSRPGCDASFPAFASAVATLRDHRIASVGIAGNDGVTSGTSFPGCLSQMVNVGASTKSDTVATFSNSFPNMLDLLAPGDGFSSFSGIQSSLPGNSYGFFSGTSMAAPHVAGAFAILKQASPGATVGKLLNDLAVSGAPIQDPRNGVIVSRINIAAALARADSTPPTTPGSVSALASTSTSVNVTWSASSDNYGIQHYTVQRRDTKSAAWVERGTTTATAFSDAVTAARTYEYRVAAVDTSSNTSGFGTDFATAILYTNDPILPASTLIRGVHQSELRQAADAWRLYAELPPAFGSYTPLTGIIFASDITAAVNALNGARTTIGLPSFTYSGVAAPAIGAPIDDQHVQQLRNVMK